MRTISDIVPMVRDTGNPIAHEPIFRLHNSDYRNCRWKLSEQRSDRRRSGSDAGNHRYQPHHVHRVQQALEPEGYGERAMRGPLDN